MTRSYSEVIKIPTFEGRLEYLRLYSTVGRETFGHLRLLNQRFYTSKEWKDFKRSIIIRDQACDLAFPGMDIACARDILIHHLNPITIDDLVEMSDALMDPENVIVVSLPTHNLIHYGGDIQKPSLLVERKPGDTIPWR